MQVYSLRKPCEKKIYSIYCIIFQNYLYLCCQNLTIHKKET